MCMWICEYVVYVNKCMWVCMCNYLCGGVHAHVHVKAWGLCCVPPYIILHLIYWNWATHWGRNSHILPIWLAASSPSPRIAGGLLCLPGLYMFLRIWIPVFHSPQRFFCLSHLRTLLEVAIISFSVPCYWDAGISPWCQGCLLLLRWMLFLNRTRKWEIGDVFISLIPFNCYLFI